MAIGIFMFQIAMATTQVANFQFEINNIMMEMMDLNTQSQEVSSRLAQAQSDPKPVSVFVRTPFEDWSEKTDKAGKVIREAFATKDGPKSKDFTITDAGAKNALTASGGDPAKSAELLKKAKELLKSSGVAEKDARIMPKNLILARLRALLKKITMRERSLNIRKNFLESKLAFAQGMLQSAKRKIGQAIQSFFQGIQTR